MYFCSRLIIVKPLLFTSIKISQNLKVYALPNFSLMFFYIFIYM